MGHIVEEPNARLCFAGGLVVSALEKLLWGYPIIWAVLVFNPVNIGPFHRTEGYYDLDSKYSYRFEKSGKAVAAYILGAGIIYAPQIYNVGQKVMEIISS